MSQLQLDVPIFAHRDLRERNWGNIEGRFADNRDNAYTQGEIDTWFTWEGKPPKGESYRQVSERVVGYFEKYILPELQAGNNVLLVGHNGMLKTLRQYLEHVPQAEAHSLNLKNCEIRLYEFDQNGMIISQKQ